MTIFAPSHSYVCMGALIVCGLVNLPSAGTQEDETRCIAMPHGESASITCFFFENITKIRPIVITVERYRLDDNSKPEEVLICTWTTPVTENCEAKDGYKMTEVEGGTLYLSIAKTTADNSGNYVCKMMHRARKPATSRACTLNVHGTTPVHFITTTFIPHVWTEKTSKGNTTGSSENIDISGQAEERGDSKGEQIGIYVGVSIAVVACIAVGLIVFDCYRRKQKKTLANKIKTETDGICGDSTDNINQNQSSSMSQGPVEEENDEGVQLLTQFFEEMGGSAPTNISPKEITKTMQQSNRLNISARDTSTARQQQRPTQSAPTSPGRHHKTSQGPVEEQNEEGVQLLTQFFEEMGGSAPKIISPKEITKTIQQSNSLDVSVEDPTPQYKQQTERDEKPLPPRKPNTDSKNKTEQNEIKPHSTVNESDVNKNTETKHDHFKEADKRHLENHTPPTEKGHPPSRDVSSVKVQASNSSTQSEGRTSGCVSPKSFEVPTQTQKHQTKRGERPPISPKPINLPQSKTLDVPVENSKPQQKPQTERDEKPLPPHKHNTDSKNKTEQNEITPHSTVNEYDVNTETKHDQLKEAEKSHPEDHTPPNEKRHSPSRDVSSVTVQASNSSTQSEGKTSGCVSPKSFERDAKDVEMDPFMNVKIKASETNKIGKTGRPEQISDKGAHFEPKTGSQTAITSHKEADISHSDEISLAKLKKRQDPYKRRLGLDVQEIDLSPSGLAQNKSDHYEEMQQ